MIIPIRCFTCGKVLANKWRAYEKAVKEAEGQRREDGSAQDNIELPENFDKNLKGTILDSLNLDRICCRRHMLCHVDLVDII